MPVATFDTLKFSKALREAGVSEKQADAEAAVLSEVFSFNFRDVVTKDDLKAEIKHLEERIDFRLKDLETRVNAKFDQVYAKLDQVEARFNAKIDQLDAKVERYATKANGEFVLIKWMLGVTLTLLVALVGIAIRFLVFAPK